MFPLIGLIFLWNGGGVTPTTTSVEGSGVVNAYNDLPIVRIKRITLKPTVEKVVKEVVKPKKRKTPVRRIVRKEAAPSDFIPVLEMAAEQIADMLEDLELKEIKLREAVKKQALGKLLMERKLLEARVAEIQAQVALQRQREDEEALVTAFIMKFFEDDILEDAEEDEWEKEQYRH